MNPNETRWKIIKALLEGFPALKERTIEYLKIDSSTTGDSDQECGFTNE